jgi:hypothetical protein
VAKCLPHAAFLLPASPSTLLLLPHGLLLLLFSRHSYSPFLLFFLGRLRLVFRLQEEWNSATGLHSDIMRAAKKSWLTIGVACCAERDNAVVERSGNGMSYFVFLGAACSLACRL